MALFFKLVTSVVGLALKPLLLAKLSCQFGVRSISIVIQTWLELLRFALFMHFAILWRLLICFVAVLSLPVRALTALSTERLQEMQLHRLKNEMENILWDRKELEEQLVVAVKERKMMEMMLMELEEEHDEAMVKIQLLQGEIQDLKDKTQQLREVQGKALWSNNVGNGYNIAGADNGGKSQSPWKPDNNKNIRQVTKDQEMHVVQNVGSKTYGLSQLYVTSLISNKGNNLALQWEVALSRSLLSAILSLVVGIVAWEAEDRCMPLLVSLFTVVTLSLASVLRLFTIIEHKPALEALLLLSINWFLLGTLACPMLPSVLRFLAPLALSFLRRTF